MHIQLRQSVFLLRNIKIYGIYNFSLKKIQKHGNQTSGITLHDIA